MDFLHDLGATEEALHVSHWDDVAEGREEIDYSCWANRPHLQITLPNHPNDGEIDVSPLTRVLKTKPWHQKKRRTTPLPTVWEAAVKHNRGDQQDEAQ